MSGEEDKPRDEEIKDKKDKELIESEEELKELLGEEFLDLISEEEQETENVEDMPLDTDSKFITPDLVELPPKWFYEQARDSSLPRGLRLTDKMKDILDKLYFEGLPKLDLIKKHHISSSTISMTLKRIRELWNMYTAGTLDLKAPSGGGGEGPVKVGKDELKVTSRTQAMSAKTTTFKEIDRAIAEFLRPQIERSTQFQEVMARIGLVTTYSMMQLGIVNRTRFVRLAELVTDDPNALFRYVASQLDTLISAVDPTTLKQFTAELLQLREQNRALKLKLEEYEQTLEKYQGWLYEAGALVSRMFERLSKSEQLEMVKWLLAYEQIKRGGVVATDES